MTYLLIYQPLYNILGFLAYLCHGNVGWAIFILAVIIRLLLIPLNRKNALEQLKLAKIQPQLQEIKKRNKDNMLKANQELRELFQKEEVSVSRPFIGVFIQMAIFIFLYLFLHQAVKLTDWSQHFYSFITIKPILSYTFLGFFNLQVPNFWLVIFSAVLNVISALIQPAAGNQNKSMMVMLPFIIVFYWKIFPAAIVIYWIAMAAIGIIEGLINRKSIHYGNDGS